MVVTKASRIILPKSQRRNGSVPQAEAYAVDIAQAFAWGTEPFLLRDFGKIILLAFVTTKVWSYESFEEGSDDETGSIE